MREDRNNSSVGYNEEMFGESPAPQQQEEMQSRPVADDVQVLLARQLAPGERLLWWGKPKKLHAPGGAGKIFAVFFLGFACFWELMALQTLAWGAGPFGIIFPLFGIPFILVGLKMLFPNLFSGRRIQDTVYAITNQRALIVTSGRVNAWDLDSVQGVEKRYYKDGTGDLVLSNGRVETYYHNGHTHSRNITMEFFGLADVDAAEAALRSR